MAILKVNGEDLSDYVQSLKVGLETLVSDNSGRNANGDAVIDIINEKKKLYVTFRHTTAPEMRKILGAVSSYVCEVVYLGPRSNAEYTITAYTGTPEPEYYTISDKTIFKPMALNFIEL